MANTEDWKFSHDVATDAEWTPGLREIFEYRDLGIKGGTKGDYVAHLIRHNGKKMKDDVQHWHVHDCTFQMVYVLNGWATFEYAGQGATDDPQGRLHQPDPRHPASRARLLRGFRGARDRGAGGLQDPDRRGTQAGPGRGVAFGPLSSGHWHEEQSAGGEPPCHREEAHVRTIPPVTTGNAQGRPRGDRHRRVARASCAVRGRTPARSRSACRWP